MISPVDVHLVDLSLLVGLRCYGLRFEKGGIRVQSTIPGAKKGAASVHFRQLVDNQHWLLRDEHLQDVLDYIIAISEQARGFDTFVSHVSNNNGAGVYVMKTHDRNRAQRFSYKAAHQLACELSRYQNQETRVERISSASSEVA